MTETVIETENTVIDLPEYGPLEIQPLPEDIHNLFFENLGKKSRVKVSNAVQVLIALANKHNLDCATVRQAADENKDPKAQLETIRVSNPNNDPKIDAINKKIEKLDKTREELIAEAYVLAESQIQESVTIEQAEVIRDRTKLSSVKLRQLKAAIQAIGEVVYEDLEFKNVDEFMALIPEVDSLRGVKLGGAESSDGTAVKLSMDKIYVDGVAEEKIVDHPTKGEISSTSFSYIAQKLNAKFGGHKNPANKITATDLSNAMYDSANIARGTKKADIKVNSIKFVFTKDVTYAKKNSDEVIVKPESVMIEVVFNYEEYLKTFKAENQEDKNEYENMADDAIADGPTEDELKNIEG